MGWRCGPLEEICEGRGCGRLREIIISEDKWISEIREISEGGCYAV